MFLHERPTRAHTHAPARAHARTQTRKHSETPGFDILHPEAKPVTTYQWPRHVNQIPSDKTSLQEYQRKYGSNFEHLPPVDPFRSEFKADLDLHRMNEKQKLESIKRDLLTSGSNLRNKMLSEAMNTDEMRRYGRD